MKYSFFFNEAAEDEMTDDTSLDNSSDDTENNNENSSDNNEDTSNDEMTDDTSLDNSSDDNTNSDDMTSDTDNEDSDYNMNDEENNEDSEKEKEEKKTEFQGRILLFDNFQNTKNLILNFLDSIDKFKDNLENDDNSVTNKRLINTSYYIIDELNNSLNAINYILDDKINNLQIESLRVLFSSITTKVRLLIQLFEKLN